MFDRFEHDNHFHPESEGNLYLSFHLLFLFIASYIENRDDDPGCGTDEDSNKTDERTSNARRKGCLLNMGEREAPRAEGCAHSDQSIDQSRLRIPVHSCKPIIPLSVYIKEIFSCSSLKDLIHKFMIQFFFQLPP